MTDLKNALVAPFAQQGGSFTMQPDGSFLRAAAADTPAAASVSTEAGEPDPAGDAASDLTSNAKSNKGAN